MIGFVYEADQEALREAQERVDELRHQEMLDKIDEAIEAIEDNKEFDNVYNYEGTEVLKGYEGFDVSELMNLIGSATELNNTLAAAIAENLNKMVDSSTIDAEAIDPSIEEETEEGGWRGRGGRIQIGDIHVHGVQNTEELSDAIVRELPNMILQKTYKRRTLQT